MVIYYLSLALGLIGLAIFLRLRVEASTAKAAMAKSFVSAMFVSAAVSALLYSLAICEPYAWLRPTSWFGFFVVIGLLFGLFGDIWLDLKFVYRQDEEIHTFAGFLAFAAGHLLFIYGLIRYFGDFSKPLYIILPIVLGILLGCATVLGAKLMKLEYGKYKAISMFYASILISMTLLSGSLALMNSFEEMTLNLMFAGGIFFLISDLILSGTYFGEGKDRPVDIITNHVTYYIAQYLIASSLLFLYK